MITWLVWNTWCPLSLKMLLTHWGRVTHICVIRLTITCSDNGLSPGRRQAIIWTSAGILLIGPLGTNFSENLFKILAFSFSKMRLKVSSAKWRPFCLGLNVLNLIAHSLQWSCTGETRIFHMLYLCELLYCIYYLTLYVLNFSEGT